MTKKDFEAIATAIKDARDASAPSPKYSGLPMAESQRIDTPADKAHRRSFLSMAKDIAAVLATTNPKFDRERFLTACGFPSA